MKTGKALKVAGALAASLALLTVLAGCGQFSKPSPRSETSSGTPAKNTSQTSPSTQASSPPASSSSSSTPGSSFASSAPTESSTSTSSSTPAASASSSAPSSTTESRPSNEVLYLLAYIKYRGGIQNITPSDLIVDEYMIGTQKGTVLPDTIPKQVSLQMAVDGKEVKVMGPAPPTPESDPMYSLKALYSIDSLVSEYYSTPAQKSQINSILQEGERHNLLEVLAVLKSQAISGTDYNGQQLVLANTTLGDNNNLGSPAGINAIIVIKGGEVSVCKTSSSQINDPIYYYYYHFTSQSLINEYYSTPVQKAHIDEDIRLGTKGYTPSSWGF